ncbi:MAG TPA: alpha/beta fold hydrolase, partial [Burkholderiales bacterium]|nr:alpha/beta fold hydrolase [Burkholderiales bacterium]
MPNLNIEDFLVPAGGARLLARTLSPTGPGAKRSPTLVFLHEGLGSIAQWRDFPEALVAGTGLPALVYDRQGHGGSDPLDLPRSAHYLHREALEELPEVLARCNLEDAILVGHSDGGSIALLYASAHPEQVRGVITEAAHVFVEEETLAGIRAAGDAWRNTQLPEKLRRYHGAKTHALFHAWYDVWLAPEFLDWNIEVCLAGIRCPLLVIQGKDDEYATEAQVEAIARQVSGPVDTLMVPH